MAAAWAYCCRLGSQDPRGSLAATRVLGDKRCHGTTKYAKKWQWHHTTEAALDAFCVEQVQQAVEAAGEGAQLADGVTAAHRTAPRRGHVAHLCRLLGGLCGARAARGA